MICIFEDTGIQTPLAYGALKTDSGRVTELKHFQVELKQVSSRYHYGKKDFGVFPGVHKQLIC